MSRITPFFGPILCRESRCLGDTFQPSKKWWVTQIFFSDRQNKEHIRENRTKNRTNNRQNRILQKNLNILLFIRLELYRITRPNSFVFILQNNQTEMALLGQTVLPPEPFPFLENTRFLVLCSRGLSKWACCFPHDGQNL